MAEFKQFLHRANLSTILGETQKISYCVYDAAHYFTVLPNENLILLYYYFKTNVKRIKIKIAFQF